MQHHEGSDLRGPDPAADGTSNAPPDLPHADLSRSDGAPHALTDLSCADLPRTNLPRTNFPRANGISDHESANRTADDAFTNAAADQPADDIVAGPRYFRQPERAINLWGAACQNLRTS